MAAAMRSRQLLQRPYPLLLGLYFSLGLVSANIDQMFLAAGLRSVLVTGVLTLVAYILFCWRAREADRAALIFAWCILGFFLYGHVYDLLEGQKVFGLLIGRHLVLFPSWLILFILVGVWLSRRRKTFPWSSRVLNLITSLLVLLPLVQIGLFEWNRAHPKAVSQVGSSTSAVEEGSRVSNEPPPDIYYIIMDGYPRADMLYEYHGVENSEFLSALQGMGFYVAPCSQSNYAMTTLSLVSSLNMDYLQGMAEDITTIDRTGSIIQSRVRQFLEERGYTIVSIETGIWFTEFHDADYFISRADPVASTYFMHPRLTNYEIMFLRTTMLRVLEESSSAWLDPLLEDPRTDIYNLLLFELDQLEASPEIEGPKFVFAHVLAPHSKDLIFGADGSMVVTSGDDEALRNELIFLNRRLLEIFSTIQAESQVPPIIILQSDHGLDPEARMANLSAFYLPDDGKAALYPSITPVNIFRLVFNTYFQQDLPLLPDTSYYSPYEEMFNFTEVSYPCEP